MKFCDVCGEVYPMETTTCIVDGESLVTWDLDTAENTCFVDRRCDTTIHEPSRPGDTTTTGLGTAVDDYERTDIFRTAKPATLNEIDAFPQLEESVATNEVRDAPFLGMLVAGRYRLDTQIGTGGFGLVFDAFDREEGRRVAIKILSPTLGTDKRALTRFRREAIAASRIEHPGIIRIEDFGIEDDGISYIVMEFLAGQDLAAILDESVFLPPKRALEITMQCARALGAAHRVGVWHRDLKPANIFVTRDDKMQDRVKIIDFGIAKDQSSNPRNKNLTAVSKVVGTPFYMSPEQARGTELDGRADLYSLGIILYEMLTGERPFHGASSFEILLAHAGAARVPPSKGQPNLRQVAGLDDLVLKSIAVKSEDRFESMDDFADALLDTIAQCERVEHMAANAFYVSTEIVEPRTPRKVWQPSTSEPFLSKKRWVLVGAVFATIVITATFLQSGGSVSSPSSEIATPADDVHSTTYELAPVFRSQPRDRNRTTVRPEVYVGGPVPERKAEGPKVERSPFTSDVAKSK